jgi:aldehyde dehydrogenase (NAD+)
MLDELMNRLCIESRHSGVCHSNWVPNPGGPKVESVNPTTGRPIAEVELAGIDSYHDTVSEARRLFQTWREIPAPLRGEIVCKLGNELRRHKSDLGRLITLEVGKIRSEAEGEVQEMIDMCDFAVGLSRQLYGLTIASERPGHRLFEQWHPLGPVGVITAFNFPVAVWAWNALIAAVCGNTTIWKPSPRTPLCSLAIQSIAHRVCAREGYPGLFTLCLGAAEDIGEALIADARIPLVSATGSCRMGRRVGAIVGSRLGRSLLELGGNNAMIVTPRANLELALRAIVFAAVGTAGQRCTSLRRLIAHESIADALTDRLVTVYASLPIGDPAEPGTLVGPLISHDAVVSMIKAISAAQAQGGTLVCGGQSLDRPGFFVQPAIIRASENMPIVAEETFAPILYVIPYRDLDHAIAIQNGVEQGLASSIFTDSVVEAERFLGPAGSDCGIANLNIGTSGAEIGGAFGGEKATGGGRESGSDAWKAYMRRQTCTINGSTVLPLSQGVSFEIDAT